METVRLTDPQETEWVARKTGSPKPGHLVRDNQNLGLSCLLTTMIRRSDGEGEYLGKVPGNYDQSWVIARVLCSAHLEYNLVKESNMSPPVQMATLICHIFLKQNY